MKLNSNNLRILENSRIEVMEDSGDDDLLCDIPEDICEELNQSSQLQDKMTSRESISLGSGSFKSMQASNSFKRWFTQMQISSDKVISISGINMVKKIVMKHVEMMAVCQSHSFELFVSLTNLMSFYTYIIANVFIGRQSYSLLMNDAVIRGKQTTESSLG